MHETIRKLREGEQRQRNASVARYRSLLELGDSLSAEQLEALQSLMGLLGLTTQQVEEHARAVTMRRDLQAAVASSPGLEQKMIAARKAHDQYVEESNKIIAEIHEKQARLLANSQTAEREHWAAYNARRRLHEVELTNAQLFGLSETEARERVPKPALSYSPDAPESKKVEAPIATPANTASSRNVRDPGVVPEQPKA